MVGIVFGDGQVIAYAVIGAILLGGLLSELRERRRQRREPLEPLDLP